MNKVRAYEYGGIFLTLSDRRSGIVHREVGFILSPLIGRRRRKVDRVCYGNGFPGWRRLRLRIRFRWSDDQGGFFR